MLLAMAPLMVLIWYVADAGRRDHEQEISARLVQIARFGVSMNEDALTNADTIFGLIGSASLEWVADQSGCDAKAREIAAQSASLASFGVVGPWGDMLCFSLPNGQNLNVADRSYVRDALSRDGLAIGATIASRITGRALVPLARRVTSSRLPEGPRRPIVLFGALDLAAQARSLASSTYLGALSADVSVDVLDVNGVLLAQWPPNERALPPDHAFTQALLSAPEGRAVGIDAAGTERIAGFAHGRTTGLVFATSVDRALTAAVARGRFLRAMGLALLAMLAGLGLAFVAARSRILRPVHILSQAARAVRDGAPMPSLASRRLPGELEDLRLAFVAMLDQIALREARLAEANKELSHANSSLEELTRADPLTGLANRRGFDEALTAAWAWGQAQDMPVAMLMVDLDHFKRFNDRYGHPAGDACLQMVASALSGLQQRATDLPARLGGEEFAVLLPGTDTWGAAMVAERLLAAIRAAAMEHKDNPTGIVTLSIGVAAMVPQPGLPMEELVAGADAALYAAKRAGRNRLHRGVPPPPTPRLG